MLKLNQNFDDLKIINNTVYKSTKTSFNFEEFYDFVRKMPYSGQGLTVDKHVENTLLPPMIRVFYEIFFAGYFPSSKTFLKVYLENYFVPVDNESIKLKSTCEILNKKGVIARVLRTYPSLVRDFHFYMLCLDSKRFQVVQYSLTNDYKKGVDLTIKYKDTIFSIALLVDTNRSNSFKTKKYSRHNYNNLHEVCVRINPFDESTRIGKYSLYNKTHLDSMVSEMDAIVHNLKNKISV